MNLFHHDEHVSSEAFMHSTAPIALFTDAVFSFFYMKYTSKTSDFHVLLSLNSENHNKSE